MRSSILEAARRADEFFMALSPIHETMRRLTHTLNEMHIPFAIAGAMAANAHGHRRTTADIDILIRREDLQRLQQRLKQLYTGQGWLDTVAGSRNFRDTIHGVKIDTLIVGDFPGDGLPKPVAFPEPETVSEPGDDGIPYVSLNTLLELKLASGVKAAHRPQDLADVIELIRVNRLPLEHSNLLNPYVAEKFCELWRAAQTIDDSSSGSLNRLNAGRVPATAAPDEGRRSDALSRP
jgi:hypothetical protein